MLEGRLATNRFAVSGKVASVPQRALAANLSQNFAVSEDAVRDRAMRSSARMLPAPNPKNTFGNEKQAAASDEAKILAEEYALYKLAALHRIAGGDTNFLLTGRLALAQNRV